MGFLIGYLYFVPVDL